MDNFPSCEAFANSTNKLTDKCLSAFERISVNISGKDPDELFLLAADSGAEDIENSEGESTVYCKPEDLVKVKEAITAASYDITSAEVIKEATNTIKITDEDRAKSILNLIEKLEDSDDVQKVYANFDISESLLQRNADLIS